MPKIKTEQIELVLHLAEVNVIIKALSEKPFREVYELIGKIHTQSNNQLTTTNALESDVKNVGS